MGVTSSPRTLRDERVVPVEDSVTGEVAVVVEKGPGRPSQSPDKDQKRTQPSGVSHGGAGTSHSRWRLRSFVCGKGARGPAHLLALRHQQRPGKPEGQWCPGRGSWVQL